MALDAASLVAWVLWIALVLVLGLVVYESLRLMLKRSAKRKDRLIALAALIGIILFLLTRISS
jgi:uncharacterized membrane protein YjfL (UPF0719 family)